MSFGRYYMPRGRGCEGDDCPDQGLVLGLAFGLGFGILALILTGLWCRRRCTRGARDALDTALAQATAQEKNSNEDGFIDIRVIPMDQHPGIARADNVEGNNNLECAVVVSNDTQTLPSAPPVEAIYPSLVTEV